MNLKEAILANQSHLRLLLDNKMFLQTAGPLRVLLCDEENPILIRYSEDVSRPLSVWTHPTLKGILADDPVIELGKACYWDPKGKFRQKQLPLKDFLDKPFCSAGNGRYYSPKQLVKAAANKLGVAHHDENDRQAFLREALAWNWHFKGSEKLNTKPSLVDFHLAEIAEWTINATDYLFQNQLEFSVFHFFDKAQDGKGEFNLRCAQTGNVCKILINDHDVLVQTNNAQVELKKVDGSFLLLRGKSGVIEISSDLLQKPQNIPYRNIVTESSMRFDRRGKNMGGFGLLYTRYLDQEEVNSLCRKDTIEYLLACSDLPLLRLKKRLRPCP
ncbi:MAG: hypothetical protein WCO94_09495 [Verrucomicrobiota bacterium]